MDISPQRVRTAQFSTAKRGLDPDEVRDFLNEVATELERAQNQSTAMEARARAAVARLQELSEGAAAAPSEPTASAQEAPAPAPTEPVEVTATVDEAETISRTLLLAQRTADTTIAEARAEAERIGRDAEDEASKTLDSTRDMSSRLLDEAREEARRVGASERHSIETEVNSLKARRDFLESDVDHLERHLADERSRLREAATTLIDLTERVPGGLGEVRRPVLSASDDDSGPGGDGGAGRDGGAEDRDDDATDGVAHVAVMADDEPDVDGGVGASSGDQRDDPRDLQHDDPQGSEGADGPTIRGDEPDPLLRGND